MVQCSMICYMIAWLFEMVVHVLACFTYNCIFCVQSRAHEVLTSAHGSKHSAHLCAHFNFPCAVRRAACHILHSGLSSTTQWGLPAKDSLLCLSTAPQWCHKQPGRTWKLVCVMSELCQYHAHYTENMCKKKQLPIPT